MGKEDLNTMKRQELMQKWEEGDLITLPHRDLIHYVWIDKILAL